jgi:hypothetical protein
MIYTDLESIALAAMQIDVSDKEQLRALGKLTEVYFDAYYNPPQFVIGVGAITYAQEKLVSFQLNSGISK